MNQDSKDIAKSSAKAIENITDILNKLAGPLAEEVGHIFADKVRVYRLRNWIAVVQRTRKMLADAGIDPQSVPSRLFLPIAEAASLEDEQVLQEQWAALLANAANPGTCEREVRTAYVEILKQLSARDVVFLNRCYETPKSISMTWVGSYTVGLGSRMELTSCDEPDGKKPHNAVDQELLDSVQRLGLVGERDEHEGNKEDGVLTTRHVFYLTTFGIRFLEACRPPGSDRIADLWKKKRGKSQLDAGVVSQSISL